MKNSELTPEQTSALASKLRTVQLESENLKTKLESVHNTITEKCTTCKYGTPCKDCYYDRILNLLEK